MYTDSRDILRPSKSDLCNCIFPRACWADSGRVRCPDTPSYQGSMLSLQPSCKAFRGLPFHWGSLVVISLWE